MLNVQKILLLLVAAAVATLSGCHLAKKAQVASEQNILSPRLLLAQNQQISGLLQLRWQYEKDGKSEQQRLQALIEIDAKRMQIALLTLQGLRLLAIEVTAESGQDFASVQLTKHRAIEADIERLAYLLVKDMQYAYWPLSEWQRLQSQTGITISASAACSRQVLLDEQPLAKISCDSSHSISKSSHEVSKPWHTPITINNQLFEYKLDIKPIDVELNVELNVDSSTPTG